MVDKVPGWPGVGLSAEEMTKKVANVAWAPRIHYAWAAGEAMTRYLDELAQGRFVARRCRSCEMLLFPPRMFCEECYRPTDEWVTVRDTGTIETFSVSYLDQDAKRIKDPIFVGVIILDSPDAQAPETGRPRMGLMHYFSEIEKDAKAPYGYKIHSGMRVRAVWKPDGEREGSVLDVKYFRPLRSGEDPFDAAGRPGSAPKRATPQANAGDQPSKGGRK